MSSKLPLTLDEYEELRRSHNGQLAIVARILGGDTLRVVARTYDIGAKRVSEIVHVVCQHRNPDVYCDELKACLKRSIFAWDVKPSLSFLRAHAEDFGFYRPGEEPGA
jgi:hypothetical protein